MSLRPRHTTYESKAQQQPRRRGDGGGARGVALFFAADGRHTRAARTGVHPGEAVGPSNHPDPAELAAQMKAAKERQKADRLAQTEAARQLTEQAKAVREEAKAARDAENAAAARLAAAARETRERAKLEKQAEAERKRLEREAAREAKEAAAAQLAAEKAARCESKEAEKAARELAVQEAKEAKQAEKAAKEARRLEEQREREAREAIRRQQQQALAAARAEEATQRALKRKAETDARAAKAEAKRARIRQDECDETIRHIHLIRDELESVGDRAQELLGKLISMGNCGANATDLQWMQALVDEAVRGQERLVKLIESATIDWRTEEHARVIDAEDDDEEEDDEDGSSGEASGSDDAAGVRVGRFGKLEVVADEDVCDEDGADAFDQDEYRRAMASLRKGRMMPSDLDGTEHD